MSTGRLEAFSDGVLAIVITLLILDIKVPNEADGQLAGALGGQWQLRHPELHRPGVTRELLNVRNRRYDIGLGVYPVATCLGLISLPLFLGLMLALALLYLLPTPDVQVA